MRLGIPTAPFAEATLDEVETYAAGAGSEALEIACRPRVRDGEARLRPFVK